MIVHVAPNGNDRGRGTKNDPLATLRAGRNALRRAASGKPKRLVVHGGTYYDVRLRLGPEDSGLHIEAAPNDSPLLVGGRRVTGWRKHGPRFWRAALPGVKAGRWDFRHLLVNGAFAPRARLPHEGHFSHKSVWDVPLVADGIRTHWQQEPTPDELTHMVVRKGDLPRTLDLRNAEFSVCHWSDDSIVHARRVDWKTGTVTFASPCLYPPGTTLQRSERMSWYSVANVREGMTEPGRWYLDRSRGWLVYWPRPDEDMASVEIVAPTTRALLEVARRAGRPVQDVTIRGLRFTGATTKAESAMWGAWRLDGAVTVIGAATNIRLRDLSFDRVAGTGIRARPSPGRGYPRPDPQRVISGLQIERCRFTQCGGAAVYAWGDECRISDCVIRQPGADCIGAVAVCVEGSRCAVVHNDIADCPYVGIAAGGADGRIAHNRVRNYMMAGDDGGAVYIYGKSKRYRCYKNIAYHGSTHNLAIAYYCDERSEGHLIRDNVAIGAPWPIHIHNALNHIIRNNILLANGPCKITFMRSKAITFDRNVVSAGEDIHVHMIPEVGVASMRGNIFFSRRGKACLGWLTESGYDPTSIEPLSADSGNVTADPRLKGVNTEDFGFRRGSPAQKLCIRAVDVSRAGTRT